MFKRFSMRSRILAVAKIDGNLPFFLKAIQEQCIPNLAAITSHGFSADSGRKGGNPKQKQKKHTSVETSSVRQCLLSQAACMHTYGYYRWSTWCVFNSDLNTNPSGCQAALLLTATSHSTAAGSPQASSVTLTSLLLSLLLLFCLRHLLLPHLCLLVCCCLTCVYWCATCCYLTCVYWWGHLLLLHLWLLVCHLLLPHLCLLVCRMLLPHLCLLVCHSFHLCLLGRC